MRLDLGDKTLNEMGLMADIWPFSPTTSEFHFLNHFEILKRLLQ